MIRRPLGRAARGSGKIDEAMNEHREAITLTREPRGEVYRALLSEALRHCHRFTLVQRRACILDASASALLSQLGPHLLEERTVSEWPGTKLLDGTATLREYEMRDESISILTRAVEGLYDWCHPARLEDPVFWRKSDGPWLVTIAHERDAYFELTPAERDDLLRTLPALSSVLGLAVASTLADPPLPGRPRRP